MRYPQIHAVGLIKGKILAGKPVSRTVWFAFGLAYLTGMLCVEAQSAANPGENRHAVIIHLYGNMLPAIDRFGKIDRE
jgi:hypothetical protein